LRMPATSKNLVRRALAFGAVALGACSQPLRLPAQGVANEATVCPQASCDEQAEQIQPRLTGEKRQMYLRECLIEHQFAAFLWERQTCETDGDCVVVQTYCPFGCGVAVAKAHASDVANEQDRLLAEYNSRADCKYKCRSIRSAVCKQRRCAPAS